jgi:hypothetical protein
MNADGAPLLQQLDFIYQPSRDVARDMAYLDEVLGGRIRFAIDAMGTRVAMVELTTGPPAILLTDHLEGDRAVYIYRTANLDRVVAEWTMRGWQPGRAVEIPIGPCHSFTTPGGHRLAVYESTRPGVLDHFAGRRDF